VASCGLSARTRGTSRGRASVARIAGVDLPREKRAEVGLTYIYGVGRSAAKKICAGTGVDPNTKVRDLAEGEVSSIRSYIDQNLQVEGDLRRETNQNIRRLQDIGSYRGIRHRRGLPVRGQRTKTNARQRKGPKPSIGGRKKVR
jgi:small subunit ribosomal protein S13